MSRTTTRVIVAEDDPQWIRFWAMYPKRVGKLDARKAWAQLQPAAELMDVIIEALLWQCKQETWLKDGGQFVPYPASWLRGERWKDEPPAATPPPKPAKRNKVLTALEKLEA